MEKYIYTVWLWVDDDSTIEIAKTSSYTTAVKIAKSLKTDSFFKKYVKNGVDVGRDTLTRFKSKYGL